MHDLRDEVGDDAFVERFSADWRTASLPGHTQAALTFTEKLTLTPHEMSQEDIQTLRRAGYDDEEVHDIVQIAAYFNYINRVADALGVPPEAFMKPWPRKDGHW